MKKLTEGQTKVVLALMQGPKKSWYELSKDSKVSIPGLKKDVIPSLKKMGIIKYDEESKEEMFSLKDRERIEIKRSYYARTSSKSSSMKILTELIGPTLIGMVFSFFISLLFGLNALIFILGAFTIFAFQFFYSFYKISHSKEVIEVFLRTSKPFTKPLK